MKQVKNTVTYALYNTTAPFKVVKKVTKKGLTAAEVSKLHDTFMSKSKNKGLDWFQSIPE